MVLGLGGLSCRVRRLIAPAALAAAVCLLPLPGLAQQIQLELGANARGEYDDNALRIADDATPEDGAAREEFTQQYGLAGKVSADVGLQTLYLNAAAAQTYHSENPMLDSLGADVEGGLAWRLGSRCSGTVAGLYRRAQTELEMLETTASNIQTSIGAKASASCVVAGYYTPSIEVSTQTTGSSLDAQKSADLEERALTASLFYEREQLSALGVRVSAFERTYTNGVALDGSPLDSSTQVDGRVVLRRKLSDGLTAQGSLGGTQFLGAAEAGPFLVFDASLEWVATPKIVLLGALERTVSVSSIVQSNYTTKDAFSLNATYIMTPKLSATGQVSYSETTFDGAVSQDDPRTAADRLDQVWAGKLALAYQVHPDVQLTTGYAYTTQTSTLGREGFTSQRLFAGVGVTF